MPESEKITINMEAVDLGKIDLLVQEGFYSNRTDFIRTSIRLQLEKHNPEIQQTVARHNFVIGALLFDQKDMERMKEKKERVKIHVIGALVLNNDINPHTAREVIDSIRVRGVFSASDEVKQAIADRIN
jgi:Arc/MetJ-type ribon-helix-helix transcriptional regulator